MSQDLDCFGHVFGQQSLQKEVEKIKSLKSSPIPEAQKHSWY